jgi:Ca-activated chloride channel family protein
MGSKVGRILKDLYRIDPELRGREEELKKAIEELLASKPDARMEPGFERELKERLLASFSDRKAERKTLRFVLARPAFKAGLGAVAACLVLAVLFQFKPFIFRPSQKSEVAVAAGSERKAPPAAAEPFAAPAGHASNQLGESPPSEGDAISDGESLKRAFPAQAAISARAGSATNVPRRDDSIAFAEDLRGDQWMKAHPEEKAAEALSASPAAAPQPAEEAEAAAPETLKGRYNDDFNTEGYDRIVESSFAKVAEEPLSTFSIDVDTASYANVRRFIESGSLPPPDAVRIEELVNYFSYDYEGPEGEEPFAFDTELGPCPWSEGRMLLRVGLQAKRVPEKDIPPTNLVFLIDVSGSMEEENKLPLVKESLKILARRMRQEDRISIAVYAGNAGLVLPPTPGNRKETILKAIDGLEAGGSTAGGEGIELAYETAKRAFMPKGNNRVVLATDGDFNVGASSDGELVRLIEEKRKEGVFLTVLGFGMGNYKDSKMQKLADAGNGNYAYIDTLSEAEKVLAKQMSGTLYTVAKDLKVQIEFNPSVVGEYRLIGYEKRALAARDFADDAKDAGELGAGSSVTALYELVPSNGAGARTDLKYQSTANSPAAASGELMTIKFRYKKPDGETSALVERPVPFERRELAKTDEDFRFAAAVAEWGLILRDSQYKGSASLAQVEKLASGARGADEEGYRAGFLRLVRLSAELDEKAR